MWWIPGNSCKSLLHDCAIRPRRREGAHVLQIAGRETLHVRERLAQVGGQAVDHLRSPTRALLAIEDHPPDVPIEQDHRRVGGQDDAQALLSDARLDGGERRGIVLGQRCARRGRGEAGFGPGAAPCEPALGIPSALTSQIRAPSGWRRWLRPASWPRPAARAAPL